MEVHFNSLKTFEIYVTFSIMFGGVDYNGFSLKNVQASYLSVFHHP